MPNAGESTKAELKTSNNHDKPDKETNKNYPKIANKVNHHASLAREGRWGVDKAPVDNSKQKVQRVA